MVELGGTGRVQFVSELLSLHGLLDIRVGISFDALRLCECQKNFVSNLLLRELVDDNI